MLYKDAEGKNFQKAYKRIGIRRDRNFSDLSNPTAGLDNLIDTLIDVTGTEFLSTDLAAIKNIFARGLTNNGYLKIAGSAVKFTSPDGITASFNPRITYQNRLDKIKIFSGEPRLNGGNGLTAKYYQNDQINFSEHSEFQYNVDPNTTSSDVFTGITTEGAIENDNFWEAGNFTYTGSVHPQSSKANTGVQWEGYFIPTITGRVVFSTNSTGYFTVDFNKEGYEEDNDKSQTTASVNAVGQDNVYDEQGRIGLSTSISGISSTTTQNQLLITNSSELGKMNTIGIGMSVVHPNIAINSTIEEYDKETGAINLVPPAGADSAITAPISNQTITFNRVLGQDVRHEFNTYVLTAYKKYRIRYRYFHHRNFDSKDIIRSMNMDYRQFNQQTLTHLRYNTLYTLDYDFSDAVKGSFNTYLDNSVLFGGTNIFQILPTDPIGLGSRTNAAQYSKLKSRKKLDITYKVKQTLGDGSNLSTGIVRRQTACGTVNGSAIVTTDLTLPIEIGNYVFGTGIPDNARVIDSQINQFVILDKPATATGNPTLTFINHRGFVKRVIVNATSTNPPTITANSSTPLLAASPNHTTTHTDVKRDMVVIGDNINAIQITGVSGPSGNQGGSLTLKDAVSANQNDAIYVYQSRGLKDNSLLDFCGKFDNTPSVQCLITTSPVTTSDTVIPVQSLGVITQGNVGNGNWNLQGFNFSSGTTIQSVNPSTNPPTITVQNTVNSDPPISKDIVSGTQFTATSNSDDRQLCCPPTDTSPPFTATEEGLNTDTVAPRPNLRFENGNLIFDELLIQVNSSSNNAEDSDTYPSAQINRKIDIRSTTANKTYKILAATS